MLGSCAAGEDNGEVFTSLHCPDRRGVEALRLEHSYHFNSFSRAIRYDLALELVSSRNLIFRN